MNSRKNIYVGIVPSELCSGCGACIEVCPVSCLEMKWDEKGFLYPNVNSSKCVSCRKCEHVCPVKNIKENDMVNSDEYYAARNKSHNEVVESSSGGIFSVLSKFILERGGSVYGAALCGKSDVKHIRIKDKGDICLLRGSKYLSSSNVWTQYEKVKYDLNNGLYVLFSGLPCQIAGLRSYLRKEYEKLICVEIVCHGVPSQYVFNKSVSEIESKYNRYVERVDFRDKREGWVNYHTTYFFTDGSSYSELARKNAFMKGYLANLYMRPSCGECRFKSFRSGADITLGDMWGIEAIDPEYPIRQGVSLVCVNTERGKDIFSKCEKELENIEKITEGDIRKFNPCVFVSSVRSNKEQDFYRLNERYTVEKTVRKLLRPTTASRIQGYFNSGRVIAGKVARYVGIRRK